MAKFRGVFPAIITPMTSDGGLNEKALRCLLEFNIQKGVHGFWLAGGTGESISLADEENNRIAEIAADQSGGRIKNIMHVGAPSTMRAAKMAEHAAMAGVDAICCVPPFFYNCADEEIVEHYRVVGAATDLPLMVYNLPQATGVEITPALMQKIRDRVPQLEGLKHSSLDFFHTKAFADMGLSCLIGSSRLMLPALVLGATGCVDGPPCLAPEPWVQVWNAYNEGDMERAQIAQTRATEIADAVLQWGHNGYFGVLKAMVSERLGIDCGTPRPPLRCLTSEQKAAARKEVAVIGLSSVAID